jgi:geranylgeranyl reductase family protein
LGDAVREQWDVVVVGGGPAGSVAAATVASGGARVLLLDRGPFPRNKVCGDGLIPDALRVLRRLGIYPTIHAAGQPAYSVQIYSPTRVQVSVEGEFITLRREVLDTHLVAEASRRGAYFAEASVLEVWPTGRGVTVVTREATAPIRARYAILATGADVRLLEGRRMVTRRGASAIALRCYVRSSQRFDDLIVSFDRSVLPGYGWIFPLPGGEYNVGCGVFTASRRGRKNNLRHLFDQFLRSFPPAVELMAGATSVTAVEGARLRCGLTGARHWDGSDVVATGECVGTTYPFTGEGIGKAMETAERAGAAALEALARDRPAPLAALEARTMAELGPRYRGYRVAERWIASARLSDFLARRVRRTARLRHAAAGILNETVDPRSVFSWRRLAWSLVRRR